MAKVHLTFKNKAKSLADLLLVAVICKAYKGELVSHKCLWYWEGLLFTPILLDVIKVTGVDVTAQFRHYWGGRCTSHQKKVRLGDRRKTQEPSCPKIQIRIQRFTHKRTVVIQSLEQQRRKYFKESQEINIQILMQRSLQ